jgi:hypothetical protein
VLPTALTLLLVLASLPATASALALEDLFGTFVGRAGVETLTSGDEELRDIDITISPRDDGGFKIEWINVSLIDGRRDVAGVERHAGALLFRPQKGRGYYVEDSGYNPFREREELSPMRGDPVHWALLDENGLHAYSFVVLEDGRYELQRTTRVPTPDGLNLTFERIVDGAVVRVGEGHAVRVEE